MSSGNPRRMEEVISERILGVVDAIEGQEVVNELFELAAIGGEKLEPTTDHPEHFGTNRLALTEADYAGRDYVKHRMLRAGMKIIDDHPLALIGVYPGRHEDLEPVVALSHTDTVPKGDIYDGTLGVLGAVKAVGVMSDQGIYNERDIMVASLSIEESSRFGSALMGSRAMFHGLSEEELDLRKDDDLSIREALGEAGVKKAREAQFGPKGHMLPTPYAVIELHVEQDKKLIDGETDLGVVHAIATPVRYSATVGEAPLPTEQDSYAYEKYFRLKVHGKADHSGATPMGDSHRADGLLETAKILEQMLGEPDEEEALSVSDITVDEAAMNKVPGLTTATLRLASDDEWKVERALHRLSETLETRENQLADRGRFPAELFELEEIGKAEAGTFFADPEVRQRQKAALWLIESVNEAALRRAAHHTVGTVASYTTSPEGVITLEVDIRGLDLESRNSTVEQVQSDLLVPGIARVALGEPLAGSGAEPVELDARLVSKTLDTINRFEIGSARDMHSAAGHDTQNAARAGIPSVMIFAQSKDGKAHNPDAYTSPENIGKGVRAQAAMMMRLANEVPEL